LLFISVGRIIEKKEGRQKKKFLSGQESKTSITAIKTALVTLISLPITSRFFSKDIAIEAIGQKRRTPTLALLLTTAGLTMKYSIIMIREIAKKKKASRSSESKAKKGELIITVTIVATRTAIVSSTESQVPSTNRKEKWI